MDRSRTKRRRDPAARPGVPAADGDLLGALHAVQHQYGYIPKIAMRVVARQLRMSEAKVYGAATFYSEYRLTPPPQHAHRVVQRARLPAQGRRKASRCSRARTGIGARREHRGQQPRPRRSRSATAPASTRRRSGSTASSSARSTPPALRSSSRQLEGAGLMASYDELRAAAEAAWAPIDAPQRPLFVVSINTSSIAGGAARTFDALTKLAATGASTSCGRGTPASHGLSPSCRCASRIGQRILYGNVTEKSPSRSRRPPRQASIPDTRSASIAGRGGKRRADARRPRLDEAPGPLDDGALRRHRSRRTSTTTSRAAATGSSSLRPDRPRRPDRRRSRVPRCAAARARSSRPARSGVSSRTPPRSQSISSATRTKATPAPGSTASSSRATRTCSSKASSSAPTRRARPRLDLHPRRIPARHRARAEGARPGAGEGHPGRRCARHRREVQRRGRARRRLVRLRRRDGADLVGERRARHAEESSRRSRPRAASSANRRRCATASETSSGNSRTTSTGCDASCAARSAASRPSATACGSCSSGCTRAC